MERVDGTMWWGPMAQSPLQGQQQSTIPTRAAAARRHKARYQHGVAATIAATKGTRLMP